MVTIYLDNHATTPVHPRVFEEMAPYLREACGNPGSPHDRGRTATEAVEAARERVTNLLGVSLGGWRCIWTSGATEANNLAILGAVPHKSAAGRSIVTCAIEHKAVLDPMERIARQVGARCVVLPVDAWGRADLGPLRRLVAAGTVDFVSIQAANNEIGTLQDLREVGRLCRSSGALLHVDATQATGKMPLDLERLGVDLASVSAHKMHGPKGVGALVCRRSIKLSPLMFGGGQEDGLRPGTLNVPGIVGLGAASVVAQEALAQNAPAHLAMLRGRLAARLGAMIPGLAVVGAFDGRTWPDRLPNNLSLAIQGVRGKELVQAVNGKVCISTAAACGCKNVKSTHVLRAIGLSDEEGDTVIRMGLSCMNKLADIDRAAEILAQAVATLRRGVFDQAAR